MPKQSELGVSAITQVTRTWLYAFQKIGEPRKKLFMRLSVRSWNLTGSPHRNIYSDFVRRFRAKRYDELKETGFGLTCRLRRKIKNRTLDPKDSTRSDCGTSASRRNGKTALPDTAGMRALMNELVENSRLSSCREKIPQLADSLKMRQVKNPGA